MDIPVYALLYSITNILNNTIYIGSTTQSLDLRWKQHKWLLNRVKHPCPHLQYAWNKYGEECFIFEDINITCYSEKERRAKETDWIEWCKPNVYNYALVAGSKKGMKLSETTKEKIRKANTGKKASKETLQRLSLSHMGNTHSEATRLKMSKTRTGKKPNISEATREKLRLDKLGTTHREESKMLVTLTKQGVKTRSSSSKYVGVCWHNAVGKWRVDICMNKKSETKGYYIDEEWAALVYDYWARKYYGPQAKVNFKHIYLTSEEVSDSQQLAA
jgi:group I intron endonuclease